MDDEKTTKPAASVPAPPAVTVETLERIADEANKWRQGFSSLKLEMETISPDDLRARAR